MRRRDFLRGAAGAALVPVAVACGVEPATSTPEIRTVQEWIPPSPLPRGLDDRSTGSELVEIVNGLRGELERLRAMPACVHSLEPTSTLWRLPSGVVRCGSCSREVRL